LKFKTSIVNK